MHEILEKISTIQKIVSVFKCVINLDEYTLCDTFVFEFILYWYELCRFVIKHQVCIYNVDVGHSLWCLLNKMQVTCSLKPIFNYLYKIFFIIYILMFVILHLGRRKERGIWSKNHQRDDICCYWCSGRCKKGLILTDDNEELWCISSLMSLFSLLI